jgi:precorrin-6A synthase
VEDWRSARAGIYERLIAEELGEDGTGAFLVWGDPALYDSTLGILQEVLQRGAVAFDYDVIPGISSVSALVARHRTGLNRVARPVQITTGRRLAEGFPEGVDDVVVMLDAHQVFRQYAEEDIDIYWGAYIGTPDELLVSGQIAEAGPRIERVRAEARERKGWIMDTYLLRRNPGDQ